MQPTEAIEKRLPAWIAKQRWFSKSDEPPASVRFIDTEMLVDEFPKLMWAIVETNDGATYQLPLGMRERTSIGPVLLGHVDAQICDVDEVVIYDALIDADLTKQLFTLITGGELIASTMRPVGAEQSNTSLVADNKYIVKIFRRLHEGANPDLEVTGKLAEIGYGHVPEVVATWRRKNHDLAVCQPYLADGTEGWALALASVRDFLVPSTFGGSETTGSTGPRVDDSDPSMAGGDFGSEAFRLGAMTASLHVALSEVFPTESYDGQILASSLERDAHELEPGQYESLAEVVQLLRCVPHGGAGLATRVHGDYHLGQTLRAVTGWFVFDFEGEPARPMHERAALNSPLKDVAGMLRSMHYAAAAGISEQMPADRESVMGRANAWEQRNRDKLLEGYFSIDEVAKLLPSDDALALLLRSFEIEKAVYEFRYEKAFRPDWVAIPRSALNRLLA